MSERQNGTGRRRSRGENNHGEGRKCDWGAALLTGWNMWPTYKSLSWSVRLYLTVPVKVYVNVGAICAYDDFGARWSSTSYLGRSTAMSRPRDSVLVASCLSLPSVISLFPLPLTLAWAAEAGETRLLRFALMTRSGDIGLVWPRERVSACIVLAAIPSEGKAGTWVRPFCHLYIYFGTNASLSSFLICGCSWHLFRTRLSQQITSGCFVEPSDTSIERFGRVFN